MAYGKVPGSRVGAELLIVKEHWMPILSPSQQTSSLRTLKACFCRLRNIEIGIQCYVYIRVHYTICDISINGYNCVFLLLYRYNGDAVIKVKVSGVGAGIKHISVSTQIYVAYAAFADVTIDLFLG